MNDILSSELKIEMVVVLLGRLMFGSNHILIHQYQVGFLPVSMSGAPVPYLMWTEDQQSWIKPTLHMYAVAWCCDGER